VSCAAPSMISGRVWESIGVLWAESGNFIRAIGAYRCVGRDADMVCGTRHAAPLVHAPRRSPTHSSLCIVAPGCRYLSLRCLVVSCSRALRCKSATASLGAMEQLGNLTVRFALQVWQNVRSGFEEQVRRRGTTDRGGDRLCVGLRSRVSE
jgi:hypothetical protein